MKASMEKNQVATILSRYFGKKIENLTLGGKLIEFDLIEQLTVDTVKELPINEFGVHIQHSTIKNKSSLEGYDMVDQLINLKNARNFVHIYRIYHGLHFLRKYTERHAIVAELGSGYCEIPEIAQASGDKYDYYCFDADIVKLNKAATRKIGKFNRILIHSDLSRGELPFSDEQVDAVLSIEFVEHIERTCLMNLLIDTNRVLKTGGYAMFTTPNVINAKAITTYHIYEYEYREFCSMLVAMGFEIVKSFGIVHKFTREQLKQNPIYKDLVDFLPSPLISPLISASDPDQSRSFSVICKKIEVPDYDQILSLDFPISDSKNKPQQSRSPKWKTFSKQKENGK